MQTTATSHTTATRMGLLGAVLSATLVLSACEPPDEHGDDITELRQVEGFQSVELRGAGELIIEVGPPTSVAISGRARTLQYTETRVNGDRLIIDVAKRRWGWLGQQGRLKVNISTPKLVALHSSGAGDISISGLNGGDHQIHVAGAHDVKATGKVDNLIVSLDGAGNIDYHKVIAANATVTLNGAGDAKVQVTHVLRATVNGVGAIHYDGQPEKVESQIHGVGSISRR